MYLPEAPTHTALNASRYDASFKIVNREAEVLVIPA